MKFKKLLILLFIIFLNACSNSINANIDLAREDITSFSHENLNSTLNQLVNKKGEVDYKKLKRENNKDNPFERYYASVAKYSPDTTPELFKTENEKLTYWINAYNASAIKAVVEYYPIKSVSDIDAPFWAFSLPEMSGFFLFQRHTFGGIETNLYYLENKVIRKRFKDPRIHFVLNCASKGCPTLPSEAFIPSKLDEQMERETKKFFQQKRNLNIDKQNKKINVSSILQWYSDDFTSWINSIQNKEDASIRDYILIYAPEHFKTDINNENYSIEYLPYDWQLNDQIN